MSDTKPSDRVWWGSFPLEIDAPRRWAIGPLRLQLERLSQELCVTTWREGDAFGDVLKVATEPSEAPPAEAELERFGFEQAPDVMHVVPALADRPIVARPEDPFYLPPRETATIYVSCPLWVQLRARADGPVLCDLPIHLPSDIWFGPNTRIGELGYASRTAARVNLGNVVFLPQRIVCPVTIRNRSSVRLDLERLKIPAPFLSVHADENGHLWTEKVTLVRESADDAAELDLARTPPPEAGATTFVQASRYPATRGALLRAFGRMVGRGGSHV